MKKKLSKQEKFDLELIYKPLFSTVSSIELSSFKDDKAFINKFVDFIDEIYKNDLDATYTFLVDYEDFINWYRVTNVAHAFINQDPVRFADMFHDQFDLETRCWERLCHNYFFHSNEEFIRKYKDKLDWVLISGYHDFTPEFLYEMKDYIDMDVILKNIDKRHKIYSFIRTFMETHLNDFINDYRNDKLGEKL